MRPARTGSEGVARRAAAVLWVAAVLAVGAGSVTTSCGGGSEEGSTAATPRAAHDRPVSDEGKSWGGWRWKGKREDCFFLVGNQCFPTLEEACRVAGCSMRQCAHDDAAPAVVSCRR